MYVGKSGVHVGIGGLGVGGSGIGGSMEVGALTGVGGSKSSGVGGSESSGVGGEALTEGHVGRSVRRFEVMALFLFIIRLLIIGSDLQRR